MTGPMYQREPYPETWARAGRFDRFLVRRAAPNLIRFMFNSMVHPGVYQTIGLPGIPTWRRANQTPQRRQMRWESTRPVLQVLLDAGAFSAGSVPGSWRSLCGVDLGGVPYPDVARAGQAAESGS